MVKAESIRKMVIELLKNETIDGEILILTVQDKDNGVSVSRSICWNKNEERSEVMSKIARKVDKIINNE